MSAEATGVPTLLQELIKNFPEKLRLALHEALARTRVKNPNDPIFELMIVLGIWAAYYERIPASLKATGDGLERKNEAMLGSLDVRLELLQKLAQSIQSAIDQLDGAPKAIIERFPAEALAKNIAAKLDARFQSLPLTKLEGDLRSLETAMKTLLGKPGEAGLAEKVDKSLNALTASAQRLAQRGFVEDRWPRDIGFALLGAVLVAGSMWLVAVKPTQEQRDQLEEATRSAYSAGYVLRKAIGGSLNGKPVVQVKGQDIDHTKTAEDGTVTIYLKE